MKFATRLTTILTVILAATMMSGCNDDNGGGSTIPDNLSTDFATFVSSGDQGSVFTLQKDGDSPLVTLTAAVKIDTEQIKPGSRVLIQYVPSGGQEVYESGAIQLYGILQITNGDIEAVAKSEIDSWRSDRMKLNSMTRTGDYINVWMEVTVSNAPQRFVIAADEATINDEYPQLYLVMTSDNEMGRSYNLYGSFDISDIWDLETCQGVRIHYSDRNGDDSKTFQKDGILPIEPDVTE